MPKGEAQGQTPRQAHLRQEEAPPQSRHDQEGRPAMSFLSGRRFATLALATAAAFGIQVGSAPAAEEPEKYELESVGVSLSSPQAGAHADFTTTIVLSQDEGHPYAQTRDVEVHLP